MSGRTKEQIRDKAMEVLEAIKVYEAKMGKMPTRREIKEMSGFHSWQTATIYVKKLEEMGYIKTVKNKNRGIRLVPEEERKKAREAREQQMYQAVHEKQKKMRKSGSIYPAAVMRKEREPLITHVRVGDIIREQRKEKEKDWMFVERTKEYRVMGIYPYCITTIEIGTGIMRAFGYGDLIVMGLEYQSPELEARKYRIMEG